MKKYKIFLYALLLPLLAAQCDKPPHETETPQDKLPPITTEGKQTFGCRVNGEVWLPKVKFNIFVGKVDVSYHKPTGGLNIAATRRIDDIGISQALVFAKSDIKSVGEYKYRAANYHDYDTSFCIRDRFEIDTMAYSQLKILRLDTENRIISGTFEYTASNDECGQVIITDGRFDLNY